MASPPPDINNGPKILMVCWIEGGLALLFVTLRLFTRIRLVRAFGWDDALIAVAMALSLVTTAMVTAQVSEGVGRHFVYLGERQQQLAIKYNYMTQIPSTFTSCFGKIAVALLLKHIMAPHRGRKLFLWFIIISLLVINTVVNVVTLTFCKPLAFLWDHNIQGSCLPTSVLRDLGYLQGAWTVFGDVTLALFPILILHNLQMKLRLKIGLIITMSLGIFAAIAASLKTSQIKKFAASRDPTYDGNDLIYYFSTENNLVIIAACIPTLKPFLTELSRLYSKITGRGRLVESQASAWPISSSHPQRNNYHKQKEPEDSELAMLESPAG